MKAFECKMCGECCYGEGISLNGNEISRISQFLGITENDFKRAYCIKRKGRYELKTSDSHYCIFLKKQEKHKICKIHPVKPDICKLWPFFPAIISDEEEWKMVKDFCPGINPDCSFEDFIKQARCKH